MTAGEARRRAQHAVEQGRAAMEAAEADKAAYFFAHSMEWAPTAEALTGLAWTLSYAGKLDEAIGQCKKAIELDPDYGNAYNDVGVYLIQQGHEDQAEVWFTRALSAGRYEHRCHPYYNLGRLLERRGALEAAVEAYEESLKLDKKFENARAALERVRKKAGVREV